MRGEGYGGKLPQYCREGWTLGQVTQVWAGVHEEAEGTSGNRPRTKKVSWDVSVAVGPGPAGLMLEPRQSLVSE